jgi:hypothetical protein
VRRRGRAKPRALLRPAAVVARASLCVALLAAAAAARAPRACFFHFFFWPPPAACSNFGSYVTHETKHFIYFYLGQVAILCFKSG